MVSNISSWSPTDAIGAWKSSIVAINWSDIEWYVTEIPRRGNLIIQFTLLLRLNGVKLMRQLTPPIKFGMKTTIRVILHLISRKTCRKLNWNRERIKSMICPNFCVVNSKRFLFIYRKSWKWRKDWNGSSVWKRDLWNPKWTVKIYSVNHIPHFVYYNG